MRLFTANLGIPFLLLVDQYNLINACLELVKFTCRAAPPKLSSVNTKDPGAACRELSPLRLASLPNTALSRAETLSDLVGKIYTESSYCSLSSINWQKSHGLTCLGVKYKHEKILHTAIILALVQQPAITSLFDQLASTRGDIFASGHICQKEIHTIKQS